MDFAARHLSQSGHGWSPFKVDAAIARDDAADLNTGGRRSVGACWIERRVPNSTGADETAPPNTDRSVYAPGARYLTVFLHAWSISCGVSSGIVDVCTAPLALAARLNAAADAASGTSMIA